MKNTLINNELLEEIRTSRNTSKWHNIDDNKIVDFGYTHEYFLANRTVDNIIKEFYLKPIKEMYSAEEWQKCKILENKDKNYSINNSSYLIQGALHNRVDLYIKIGTLLDLKEHHGLNIKYKYLSDLNSYFKNYADNFKRGYRQFLNVIVKPHLLFENNKEEASHIIFRFITNNQLNDPVVSLNKGFKMSSGDYDIDYEITDGLLEGYLYKAWSIIFTQNELFLPIFKNYLVGDIITDIHKTELKKDDILKMQNNLIPRISLEYVYDFFKILIEPNKKGTFYLNEQKLLIFIESTFVNKKPVQQYFNQSFSKDKLDVRSLFRKFYINCNPLDYDKKNVNRKYFDIMNNAFIGFDDKVDYKKWYKTSNEIPTIPKPKCKYVVAKGNL